MNEDIRNSPDAPSIGNISPAIVVALGIIALQIIIAIGTYPFLPTRIPVHWNAAGEIDSYANKGIGVLTGPAIGIATFLIFYFGVITRKYAHTQDPPTAQKVGKQFLVGTLVFLLLLQCIMLAVPLRMIANINFLLCLVVSVFFIFIGNSLGKLQRNNWAGIRTPWTLASDVVWERTHRLGGWLFVASGMIGVACAFIPFLRLWGIIVPIVLASVFLYIYSYMIYRRIQVKGNPA